MAADEFSLHGKTRPLAEVRVISTAVVIVDSERRPKPRRSWHGPENTFAKLPVTIIETPKK